MLEEDGAIKNRITYTGQMYDGVTGQYYLRARFYNPQIGRFMQEDTYRGDGLNLYAYCANNPVTYYDPSGYMSLCFNAKSAPGNGDPDDLTSLYRSVSAEEYEDIMKTGHFNLAEGQFEAKQFGMNAEETLKFANWDKLAVAVLEVQVPTSVLNQIGDFTRVDVGIFKGGNVTIPGSSLGTFNNSIIGIYEKY